MNSSLENRTSADRLSDKSFNRVLMEIVGPILIMLMVGSLVFFLIEIFYRGPHALRLGWVLGLFTAASVLVSRISIQEGLERAMIFGFALAAATLYVTVTLVDFEYGGLFFLEPVVVILLIAIVMWSTNRLTWDCTVIDASRDVSSIGLAELVKRRLFRRGSSRQNLNSDVDLPDAKVTTNRRWWFVFFANSKSQNTPGLWVFYFAWAAFPIFGFGQWFAQPSPGWGYRWIFLLFAIYLGSALGLLMLTSLLGLERYLRKRGATLPASVSINWLLIGTVFALAVMLVMLLLPSPSLSTAWKDSLGFLTTKNKDTSVHAVGDDGQADGDKPKKEKQDQDADGAKEKPGEKGAGQGDKGKGGDKKSDAKGDDSSGDKKSNDPPDSKKDADSKENQQDDQAKKPEQNKAPEKNNDNKNDPVKDQNAKNNPEQTDPKEKDPERNDPKNQNNDPEKQNDDPKNAKQANKPEPKPDDGDKKAKQNQGGKQNANPPKPSNTSNPSQIAEFLGGVIKYVVYGIGLVALIVFLWMFRDELAKLWAGLFEKKKDESSQPENKKAQADRTAKPLAPFSQFKDPFQHGLAAKWPPAQTIQHSFLALEAWARGHNHPREHDQTPLEFANQLQQVDEKVAVEARKLADLLGESLYSGGAVDRSDASKLQRLWKSMNANVPGPGTTGTAPDMQLANEN